MNSILKELSQKFSLKEETSTEMMIYPKNRDGTATLEDGVRWRATVQVLDGEFTKFIEMLNI